MDFKLRFSFLLLVIVLFSSASTARNTLSYGQILNLVNEDRVKHGLTQLRLDPTLNLAAQAKAEDMISKKYFGHESPEGQAPWHWFKALGYNYSYAGENLATGFDDPSDLVLSWMASPKHRANILSPFYSEVGFAIVNDDDTNVIVQFFGSKENKIVSSK